jgi:hypothetical protein
VQTDLHNYERHRPVRHQDMNDPYYRSEHYTMRQISVVRSITGGYPIDPYGEMVFKAIEENQFYIAPHIEYLPLTIKRFKNIKENKSPNINTLI